MVKIDSQEQISTRVIREMNNSIITTNIVRIIVLLLVQVWIFNSMSFNIGVNIDVHFIIYPLAILALPVRVPTALVLIIAFFIGLLLMYLTIRWVCMQEQVF